MALGLNPFDASALGVGGPLCIEYADDGTYMMCAPTHSALVCSVRDAVCAANGVFARVGLALNYGPRKRRS